MEKRIIKNTDIKIAPVNLGGNVFGWTLNEKESFNILDQFVANGFNFIDTANTYSWWINGVGGQSETIIGNWLKIRGNRDKIIIATKVGSQTKEHPNDISKKHILESAEASLKRLQTDYIDLYYSHFDDEKTPVTEILTAYDELISSGKVRYIGVSNFSAQRITDSFKVSEEKGLPRYVALQPHYNLLVRDTFEKEYAPVAEKYNLSVFTYFSLEAGFLTGKYRSAADFSKSPRGEGLKKYFNEKGKAVLTALDSVSEKHNSNPATVALAWLLAHPLVTAPVVSATNDRQLQTIFEAPTLKLDATDMTILNNATK